METTIGQYVKKKESKQKNIANYLIWILKTWSDKGWTKLHRIIRHQLASHKKMVRVLTHTGVVDVTDDHSLILNNGEEISPKNVNIGDELLHKKIEYDYNFDSKITIEEAKIMGFFFGDGICGTYNCASGKKSSWALNNASKLLLDEYLELCLKVYPDFEWRILDTLNSSGVYKLSPKNSKYGSIKTFTDKFRKIMYFDNNKIIPNEILNANSDVRQAFFDGLYDADGDKDMNGYTRIDQKSQISSNNICLLAQSLGWSTSLNTRNDKQDIYRITLTKNKQRKNPIKVKKIYEINYSGYVYDLTTENHHFAAGVGDLIVHNTDSVFFTFNLQTTNGIEIRGKKALEITIELAQEAGKLASAFLKGPHDLEYEKTFMPFCLLSKKRYVGMLYELDPNKGKRKEMGIVLKRRDNAPIVKDIYGGIIDILMKEKDIGKSMEFLKACLQDIVDEKVPIDKLIITKSLRAGYKKPKSIAHKVLADRIGEREQGNKPASGDRIAYVYIHTNTKSKLQGDKIETPAFIAKNKLKIDYSFYITNQIMKPLLQVYALVLEKIWKSQNKISKINNFKKEVAKLENNTEPNKFPEKLEKLKNAEAKKLLFDNYLRKTNNQKQGLRTMDTFFNLKNK